MAKGMTHNEIKAELVLRGIKIKDIARQAGVSGEAVSMAIAGKYAYQGRRIRPYIARAIGRTESEIWPPPAE
ncbi:MAG TPA: transcriptional regulator [Desulfotomaculum sp.]|jgi:lambda repressor-like predicted transcriptional regulator|nr:transcriptional regulator [Desulfotomaculum sp.]